MSDASEWIGLLEQGLRLWTDGTRLCYRLPRGAQDTAPRSRLRELKSEIVGRLRPGPSYALASFAQERLWFLDRWVPTPGVYHIPLALERPDAPPSPPVLERALGEMTRRHESLRTSFITLARRPVQVIDAPGDAPVPTVPEIDLRALPGATAQTEARRLAAVLTRRHFDLSRPPLWRTALLRPDAGSAVLLLVIHHIVTDAWSLGVFTRELGLLCGARRPRLPDLTLQSADFAAWQRRWVRDGAREEQLAWWTARLAGKLPQVELPTDRPRPAAPTYRGAVCRLRLPDALSGALRRLGRDAGVSLYTALLAAFMALLARTTQQDDVVVGSPAAHRHHDAMEGLIGFFINTLILRGDLSGNPGFRELLARIREVTLGALARQDLPFEQLVEALRPRRRLTASPLFNVLFLLNPPNEATTTGGFTAAALDLDPGTSKFDLTMAFEETTAFEETAAPRGLGGWIEYSTDLFDRSTILRFAAHFEVLAAAAVADPQCRLDALALLSPPELQQILREWNDTATAGRPPTVVEAFRRQATATPDAAAVVFEAAADAPRYPRYLSYGELAARANRLARYLRRAGVGPDARVGLCVERSPEMAVGVLGILAAGAAYVPLDPSYPRRRLELMIAESRGRVILTQARVRRDLLADLAGPAIRLIALDEEWPAVARQSAAPLDGGPDAHHLAYVIYTSGSTGRPKGIALPHVVLGNLFEWLPAPPPGGGGLLAGARTLQLASLSFDVCPMEMFAAWGSGGCLVLVPDDLRRDIPALARFLGRAAIEKVILPMVLLGRLAEEVLDGDLDLRLREITATGEPLHVTPSLAGLFERFPGLRLHNQYGPSENHVVSAWPLPPAPLGWPALPPIGRPIARAAIYLLDPRLRPVSVAATGEVVIGGISLARGYLSQPGKTAGKFVPDPFAGSPGRRLYRSGDLARYLPGGEIDFLGRMDHQVKIRGFRVELGEIESGLEEHPGVREAVVLARSAKGDERRLVAYVVPQQPEAEGDEAPRNRELRLFLGGKLPAYMVPSSFVVLAALPLSPNGKVDRRSLPAPDGFEETRGADSAPEVPAPDRPLTLALAAIWSEVLGLDEVRPDDDFFQLGGHSLLAIRLTSRLRERFGVRMSLGRLFERPTLRDQARDLAAALGYGGDGGERRAAAPGPAGPGPVRRGAELPLAFVQQRLWFLDRLEPGSPAYNMPAAFDVAGPLDAAALESAFREIVRRHEILRTAFPNVDGRPRQVVAPEPGPIFSAVDLGHLAPARRSAEARRLVGREADRPFDLARGPVIRITLLRLADEEHVLLRNLHHIVADARSEEILGHELTALYDAARRGRPATLPVLPLQYADFALWQRLWLSGEVLERQLAYWTARLRGAPALLELPTDRPRPALGSRRGAAHRRRLPEDLGNALRELGRERGGTLFTTTLALFMTLLQRATRRHDLVVSTPTTHRDWPEIRDLIGFFLNTLALRGDLSGDPSFDDVLDRVREVVRGGLAHQDLPFEKLVEELQPERHPAYAPLAQIHFLLRHTSAAPRCMAELTLGPRRLDVTTSKFDLTLALLEDEGHLVAWIEYNPDLFDSSTIARFAASYEGLAAVAVSDPGRPVSGLPLLSAPERRQLRTPAGGPDRKPSRVDPGFVAPRDDLETALAQIWTALLGIAEVGVHDEFFALGGHSLLAVRLTARIERRFGVDLPIGVLFRHGTVAALAGLVRERRTDPATPLVAIRPTSPAEARHPLFCVHPGGGQVLCYRDLSRHLGSQPFYGLQSRGHDGGEALHDDVPSMAARYLEAIREVEPEGPYLLGGWSMGGVVAFEMARQLRRRGQEVRLLALIDTVAPSPPEDGVENFEELFRDREEHGFVLESFARDLGLRLGAEELADHGLERILEEAHRAEILGRDVDLTRLDHLCRLFRHNYAAMRCYPPRPYPGAITLLRARDGEGRGSDPTLGWGKWAAGGVEVCVVPGDHYSLVREPHVRVLADELRARFPDPG